MELNTAITALSALGEPTRLTVFRLLVEAGPDGMVVGQIADRLTVAPATLSFHLKTLNHAGLVSSSKEQRFVRYIANFTAMNELVGYLTDHCCGGHPERCLPGAALPSSTTAPEENPRAA